MLTSRDPLPDLPRRVLVAGTSGAGKTSLAGRVATVIDAPHTEIDGLFHGPGWTPRPQFADDVADLAAGPSWVTEWQYEPVRQVLLARADLLVWLDLPRPVVMWRVTSRTVRRRLTGTVLWNGNVEPPFRTILTDRDHIVRWAFPHSPRHRRQDRRRHPGAPRPHGGASHQDPPGRRLDRGTAPDGRRAAAGAATVALTAAGPGGRGRDTDGSRHYSTAAAPTRLDGGASMPGRSSSSPKPPAPSRSMVGRMRSSQRGSHQFRSPNSTMLAGTSTILTMVASIRMAVAKPIPNIWITGSGWVAKLRNTAIMIRAALVMTRAVVEIPRTTLPTLSPVARYSSRTRDSRKTS